MGQEQNIMTPLPVSGESKTEEVYLDKNYSCTLCHDTGEIGSTESDGEGHYYDGGNVKCPECASERDYEPETI